eukprot:1278623-Prymnesium_polylepis.2
MRSLNTDEIVHVAVTHTLRCALGPVARCGRLGLRAGREAQSRRRGTGTPIAIRRLSHCIVGRSVYGFTLGTSLRLCVQLDTSSRTPSLPENE